jgi:predicted flap endonuclease-1-like 5' DNA nuclease
MQRHLHDMSIFTFAQLASADAEVVRESLGELGRLAKCEEWIAQAADLNRSESAG